METNEAADQAVEIFEGIASDAIETSKRLTDEKQQLVDVLQDGTAVVSDLVEAIADAYDDVPLEDVPDELKEVLAHAEMWARNAFDVAVEIDGPYEDEDDSGRS